MAELSKETFIVVSEASGEELAKDLYICDSLEEVNDQLEDLTFANLDPENNKTYHGVLISGHTIPDSFQGCTPYIIVKNPERYEISVLENEAMFLKESCSPDKVAETITNILNGDNIFDNDSTPITIDDVFIFLGRELIPVLQIVESAIFHDEEFCDRIERMVEKFKQL